MIRKHSDVINLRRNVSSLFIWALSIKEELQNHVALYSSILRHNIKLKF